MHLAFAHNGVSWLTRIKMDAFVLGMSDPLHVSKL